MFYCPKDNGSCWAKINGFGISMKKHFVAATTDGAAVMIKFSELSGNILQAWYAHYLHLPITDVIYNQKNSASICNEIVEVYSTHEDFNYVLKDN